jgi:hypothetical protein
MSYRIQQSLNASKASKGKYNMIFHYFLSGNVAVLSLIWELFRAFFPGMLPLPMNNIESIHLCWQIK